MQEHKEKQIKIFLRYLKYKFKEVDLPYRLHYEEEDLPFLNDIRTIVMMMIREEAYRPTFEDVDKMILNIKQFNTVKWKY